MINRICSLYRRHFGEDIALERKISLVFFFSGAIAAVASILVYIIQGTPFLPQIPTILTLIICIVVPMRIKADSYVPIIIFMSFILYAYLPYSFFQSGTLNSPSDMFFVMGVFMFGFIIRGKVKAIALTLLILEFTGLLFLGAFLPEFEYSSRFLRGLDFGVSFVVVAGIACMVTSVITVAYRAEQNKIQRLLDELREKNSELEILSIIDPLTGCYNRRYLYANCEHIIGEHKASRMPLAMFVTDVDHFKQINDAYGHSIGDDILKLTVGAMKSAVRLNDMMIRYGGDEFVILLPACDEENAMRIAERIRAAIENCRHRNNIQFTVSIGVAMLGENDSLHTLIDRADMNLYAAKSNGRNQVEK